MNVFREKSAADGGQNNSDVSDEEGHPFNDVVTARVKTVPECVPSLGDFGASTSIENGGDVGMDEEKPPIASKSAGHLWADTVLMQSLEDKMGVSAGPGTTLGELRDRGTETYALKSAGRKRRRGEGIAGSHPWRKPLKRGQKRFKKEAKIAKEKREQQTQKQRKMIPPEKFVPHKLLTPNYATEKLLNAEFDPDLLSEEQLAQGLTEALGETMPELLQKVVHFAGKSHAVELFRNCQEVERNGGMLTQNRQRRRTPGGVFMKLFNESKQISDGHKKALHEFSTEKQRQSGGFPKWWEKMKERKNKRAEETKQRDEAMPSVENEIKALPNAKDLIKPELTAQEMSVE